MSEDVATCGLINQGWWYTGLILARKDLISW